MEEATIDLSREAVHEALDALYDDAALGRGALAARFAAVAAVDDLAERSRRLRGILLEAIEVLRPARRGAFASREARACDVLTLRYVERLGIPEMMEELSLGRRQVFRDLSAAEERLATILARWSVGDGALPSGNDSLSGELALLESQPAQVRLEEVVREALALVAPLAQARGVAVEAPPAGLGETIVVDRAILKQLLVQLLSWCLQQAPASPLKLIQEADGDAVTLSLLFSGEDRITPPPEEARRIAGHEGMSLQVRQGGSTREVRLGIRRRQSIAVLVVEDNPGAVELYRRYLGGSVWRLSHVSEPRLTAEVARRQRPDVIVLDIMMPKMDGWSVLQGLRQQEETRAVPVVICSVVEDRELARALGAAATLKKPVSQADFLAALHLALSRPEGR